MADDGWIGRWDCCLILPRHESVKGYLRRSFYTKVCRTLSLGWLMFCDFFFLGPVVLSASHVALHALQVSLKLLVPPKPAECWDDRDVPSYSAASVISRAAWL